MSEINTDSLGKLAVASKLKPTFWQPTTSFNFNLNGESFISKLIGKFCYIFLIPFLFAGKIENTIIQRFIILIYMLILLLIIYKIITSLVIPIKTTESLLYIKCIIYWVFFLIMVMILCNNFKSFVINDYI